ncbi:MAG TPA: sialate O-acetylesterase [Candidatus Ratteibacteria bacterium]|jgi:sialate O-acetylesterase|uniref:Sialate O-acetylesterase domain-containing protein n=1 Tax=candidate division TA06 bacterium ADurb.Bin131 TaxID=1852827 RepID=A0A1V6C9U6_UNCT6|nr:MAG: hypothetical protein BWX89_00858 [candidate division TA06 bacterium ADurb.Bin131]HOC01871.1 sialate O-acetylesterase [bacterium]HRS05484.1 sialate O-acetylesterase [Candidatus Ratteibacteria bacterium]HON06069.1 sialate O-acetylesterase [bacterium]HOQ81618.1 sialate O-acetylesterase [bacterium]
MIIEIGLFDNTVLQMNKKNVCDVEISGKAEKDGKVFVKVMNEKDSIVKGFSHNHIGYSEKGTFKGVLKGLKAGGPYLIEITIEDKNGKVFDRKKVKNVLVGYVWVAAGQSNMQGCGLLKDAAKPHPMVRAFYMNDKWDIAKDPIHNLWECVDDVHIDLGITRGVRGNPFTGTGPAVAFAQEMFRLTGIPQGILACAHGGTTMTQWDPLLKHLCGKSLYGATLRRIKKNSGRITGIIWYQGESDANEKDIPYYTDRMKNLISSFRDDLKTPDLPFVAVQIGRLVNVGAKDTWWNSIQEKQFRLLEEVKNYSVVPAVDLSLDDTIHVSGKDQNRLGKRMAYAMNVLLNGKTAGKPPIQMDKISIKPVPPYNFSEIRIQFKNVSERFFVSEGVRPSGFCIGDPEPSPFVYDTIVSGNCVIIRSNLPASGLDGKFLYYGYGTDPYCNIRDIQDKSLCVFGPVMLGQYRALTPMCIEWDISFPFNLPEGVDSKLNGLTVNHQKEVIWQRMKFQDRFCDLHEKTGQYKDKDFIIWFSREFKTDEPMSLAACIGYDGPIKVWIDDKEIFHDPEGTNPAWEDKAKVKFQADAGKHKIVIGLGGNRARAWGIYFRFERLDIPENILKDKNVLFKMPEWI